MTTTALVTTRGRHARQSRCPENRIAEEHPYAVTLSETDVRPTRDELYFRTQEGQYDDTDLNYQWAYSLSNVVNALIGAGLILEFLNEYEKTFYQRLPYMEKVDDRWWTIPGYRLPLTR